MDPTSLRPFRSAGPHAQFASIESWQTRLSDPSGQKALWLKFQVMISRNGFARQAEVSAILFQKNATTNETVKTAFRQIFDIRDFQVAETADGPIIQINGCEYSARYTRGAIATQGKTFRWDFAISATSPQGQFNLSPTRWVEQKAITPAENLLMTGKTWLNESTTEWTEVPGMLGHWASSRLPHSWIWSQCNSFVNEAGQPTAFLFEGMNGRGNALFGKTLHPRIRSFFFFYRGKEYEFNSIWDGFRSRSENTLTDWRFQADRGPISFRGHLKAELKDFAGLTFEDTDGQPIYSSQAQFGNLTIWVYRAGKLEETLHSRAGAAFEISLRKPNPYVSLLF